MTDSRKLPDALSVAINAVADERNGKLRAMLDTPTAMSCLPIGDRPIRTARPGPAGTYGIAFFKHEEIVARILQFGAALTGPEAQAKGWGLWIIDGEGDLLVEAALPGTMAAFFIGGRPAEPGQVN